MTNRECGKTPTPERLREIIAIAEQAKAETLAEIGRQQANVDQANEIISEARRQLRAAEGPAVVSLLAGLSREAIRVLELTGERGIVRRSTATAVLAGFGEHRKPDDILAELWVNKLAHGAAGARWAALTERGLAARDAAVTAQLDRLGL